MVFTETTLPKNITLHRCLSTPSNLQDIKYEKRPLALIFAWLLAKDEHLIKYRQLWHKRGLDVLTVQTSLSDILLPRFGSQIIAKNVVKVLLDLRSEYNEVVVHGFSVGCYQFGEVLVQMFGLSEEHSIFIESIKGMILDSVVVADNALSGLSKTLASNRVLQLWIETTISLFFKICHNITVKHFKNAEAMIIRSPLKCPGLVFYSKNDLFCYFESIERLIQNRRQFVNEIRGKCWDQSTHVLHYKYHQKEYEQELDTFLGSLKIKTFQQI